MQQRRMPLSVLWPAGPVLQLLRLAELYGPRSRALYFAAAGAALGRLDLHHLSAAVPARVHVLASPHLSPLLQRRPGAESNARELLPLVAAVEIVWSLSID